ncbi:MAG: cyclic nucleotide-binding domain-containing protein [Acidimicrobiales bacterium]|nr:cyclic nucleotide-binding domain-containing protein [Acidimicrobiales bacterium]
MTLEASRAMVEVAYSPGQVLMGAGTSGDEFIILTTGTCRVVERLTMSGVHHPVGVEGPEIARVDAYALLGEIGLLTRAQHRHDVVAVGQVTGLKGDAATFAELLEDRELAEMIGSTAAQRLASQVVPVPAETDRGHLTMLRPMLPVDRPDYIHKLATASAETILNRFFSRARPTPKVIERLLNIDFVHQFVWVASDPDDLAVTWGEGRYILDPRCQNGVEMAVTVDEDQRGKGLGNLLVGAVAASAAAAGFDEFTAYVLAENAAMRAVLNRAGASWKRFEPGVVSTSIHPLAVAEALIPDLIGPITAATSDLIHAAEVALS